LSLALCAGSIKAYKAMRAGVPTSCEQDLCQSSGPFDDVSAIADGLLANLTIAAGAAAQAAIGMGLNLFAVPILALIDPAYVPGPVLFHSFLISVLASFRLRAEIDRRELGISVGGLLAGTTASAVALTQVSSQVLPRLFGALVLLAVAITAAGLRVRPTARGLLVASTLAGAMGTVAGVHGPPIALIYQNESPQRIRSALLPFFVFANGLSLVALVLIGMFGWQELWLSLVLLPGLVVGFGASPWLIRAMTPGAIRACILAISATSGLALLLKG
jgi:uncharacterized protein